MPDRVCAFPVTGQFRLTDSDTTPVPRVVDHAVPYDIGGSSSVISIPQLTGPDVDFPELCPESLQLSIIHEWQSTMHVSNWIRGTCAACGQLKFKSDLTTKQPSNAALDALVDPTLAENLRPRDYNFEAYRNALLHPKGLTSLTTRAPMHICPTCESALWKGRKPIDSIANKLYYAYSCLPEDVRSAFSQASPADLQYASACRLSRITYLITVDEDGRVGFPRQRMNKGHCAIIPQDFAGMSAVLPARSNDDGVGICVVFVRHGSSEPTIESVRKLHPLLVSLSRVRIMSKFLADFNEYYNDAGIRFSEENVRAMRVGGEFLAGSDSGVTSTIEVTSMDGADGASVAAVGDALTSGYVPNEELVIPDGELFLQTVGYGNEYQSTVATNAMKARALQWCLDRRPFVRSTGGERLFADSDPRMLTFAFPHLDPYGIGGFHHPERQGRYRLSLPRQLKNLMLMDGLPFARDPSFPYVCFNAMQRMQTMQDVTFRLKERDYVQFAEALFDLKPELEQMQQLYSNDNDAQPRTEREHRATMWINKIRVVCRDVMASNGSKERARVRARAMLKAFGCPALFVTLNPTDVHSRELFVLCGGNPDAWEQMSAWERAKLVADHPCEAAIWFDKVISMFLNIVLRHGRGGPGLFG
ncbi:hypothetical protein K488DRAFT_55362, partial [Vararia minispora EC-137]